MEASLFSVSSAARFIRMSSLRSKQKWACLCTGLLLLCCLWPKWDKHPPWGGTSSPRQSHPMRSSLGSKCPWESVPSVIWKEVLGAGTGCPSGDQMHPAINWGEPPRCRLGPHSSSPLLSQFLDWGSNPRIWFLQSDAPGADPCLTSY